MANTVWAGDKDNKLYLQSGEITTILKTSLAVGTIDNAPHGVAWDQINTPWVGTQGKKLYLQSGQFSSILKTSKTARINNDTSNASPLGISWDRNNTPWVEQNRDTLILQSGQFSSIVKTSLDVTAIDTNPRGISYGNNGHTPWCGMQADKLYLQSGQFTSTLKTSQAVGSIDSSPEDIAINIDGNTPWVGNQANKLYLTSGQFSSILKTSITLTPIDARPRGIDSTSRLNLAQQNLAQTLTLVDEAKTGQISSVFAENFLFLTQSTNVLFTVGTEHNTYISQEFAFDQVVVVQLIAARDAENSLLLTDEALPERTRPAGDVVADTVWCGDQNFKLFKQSGRFTSIVKTSQVVNGGSSAAVRGVSYNKVDTPWVGHHPTLFGGTRMYLQSGQFDSVLKTSAVIPGLGPNDQANGISWDGNGNTAVQTSPPADTRLILFSGQFTTTVKASVSIGASGGKGISWMKDDVMWCDESNDKLKIQSGHISSTLKTSQSIGSIDGDVSDVAFTGGHTLWCGASDDKLYLQSGFFTSTLKTSQSISSIDLSPSGIETDNVDARLQNQAADIIFVQNSIDFVQVVLLGPVSKGVTDSLALDHAVTINFNLSVFGENAIVFDQLARQNILFVDASNTLVLVADITANIVNVQASNILNFQDTADQNIKEVSLVSEFILIDNMSAESVKTLTLVSDLFIIDMLADNQEQSSLANLLEILDSVSFQLTTACLGDGIILTYPFDSPTHTITLRNPDFGNLDRLEFTRINRESRGGTLIVFRDEDWPIAERQSYQFSSLSRSHIIHLHDFLSASLGQEIGLLDHENRQWKGVILNPEADTAQQGRESFIAQFDFEGDLV